MRPPPQKAAARAAGSLSLSFVFACLVMLLVKLWLVHGDEIVARDYPFDDPWYVISASRWYWFGPYDASALIRLPMVPLWIASASLTGLPLRVSTELLLAAAAFAFAFALIKAGQPPQLCAAVYAAVLFHPMAFYIHNYAHSDAFYAPVLLLSVACVILSFLNRDAPRRALYAALAGCALAVLWHTRHENQDVLLWLGAFGLILAALGRGRGTSWRPLLRQLAVLVGIPAGVIALGSLALKSVQYATHGVFATSDMSAPGFVAAHRALLRIRPRDPRRFVALPRETRQRAYAVSPAFRELEPQFEGEYGRRWASYAPAQLGVGDEIATGWFSWALRFAPAAAGSGRSAAEADRFFRRVAGEVNAACDDGRLESRWTFHPFLDPDPRHYVPHLPSSLARVAESLVSFGAAPKERDAPGAVRPEILALFDRLGNRRAALTGYGSAYVVGWVHVKEPLEQLVVRDREQRVLASTSAFTPRPDVAAFYAGRAEGYHDLGYSLTLPLTSLGRVDGEMVFVARGGAQLLSPLAPLQAAGITAIAGSQDAARAIEAVEVSGAVHALEDSVQNRIWAAYGSLVRLLTLAAGASVVVLLVCRRSIDAGDPVYAVLPLLGSVVLSRVALFALIDASTMPGISRYQYPVMGLYASTLLVLVWNALAVLRSRPVVGRAVAGLFERFSRRQEPTCLR